jgi:hypothetical protein
MLTVWPAIADWIGWSRILSRASPSIEKPIRRSRGTPANSAILSLQSRMCPWRSSSQMPIGACEIRALSFVSFSREAADIVLASDSARARLDCRVATRPASRMLIVAPATRIPRPVARRPADTASGKLAYCTVQDRPPTSMRSIRWNSAADRSFPGSLAYISAAGAGTS